MWKIGDSVDVEADDIYCPGKVIDLTEIKRNKSVLIHYIGWDNSFDEWIESKSKRLHKGGSYVVKCNAWTKFDNSLCYWPCDLYIRSAVGNNREVATIEWLKQETKSVCMPYGPAIHQLKPYVHGVWMASSKISPFAKQYKERVDAGMRSKFAAAFSFALQGIQSNKDSTNFHFNLIGSYCDNMSDARAYGVLSTPITVSLPPSGSGWNATAAKSSKTRKSNTLSTVLRNSRLFENGSLPEYMEDYLSQYTEHYPALLGMPYAGGIGVSSSRGGPVASTAIMGKPKDVGELVSDIESVLGTWPRNSTVKKAKLK